MGPGSSIHLAKWANGLSKLGHEVVVITFHKVEGQNYDCPVYTAPIGLPFGVFLCRSWVNAKLRDFTPDIVNIHWASSYGLLAKNVSQNFPVALSVWGTDVFDFPYKSRLHRKVIKSNLVAANHIVSTSECMREQVVSLGLDLDKISVTPFGVETKEFAKDRRPRSESSIVLGTVKGLEEKYGVDTLIDAFALLLETKKFDRKISLNIYGIGSQRSELEARVSRLGLEDSVFFGGHVAHSEVPKILNSLDIYCALSRSESFGVAIVEASSCELPVVVSGVGGLLEVVDDKITGFIVPKEDPEAACKALTRLIEDSNLRNSLGLNGRRKVEAEYSWDRSLMLMERVYNKTIGSFRAK